MVALMLRPITRSPLRAVIRAPLSLSLLGQVQAMFASNAGALYVNDPATMYQDSAGSMPVTAVDQPVGLWVDQSKGGEEAQGSEVLSNPGRPFTDATGWKTTSASTSLSVVGGRLVAKRLNTNSSWWARSQEALQADSWYRVTTKFKSDTPISNPDFQILVFDEVILQSRASIVIAPSTSDVELTLVFRAVSTGTHSIIIGAGNNESDVGKSLLIDGASVRQIPGNHAAQSTAASRPLLKQDGGGRYYLQFDGIDDRLVCSAPINLTTRGIAAAAFAHRVDGFSSYCRIIANGKTFSASGPGSFNLLMTNDSKVYCHASDDSGLKGTSGGLSAIPEDTLTIASGFASGSDVSTTITSQGSGDKIPYTVPINATNTEALVVGANIDGSNSFAGDIYRAAYLVGDDLLGSDRDTVALFLGSL